MDIRFLVERAFDSATRKGFHLEDLSFDHFMALVLTELSEIIEADRNGRNLPDADIDYLGIADDCNFKNFFEEHVKDSLPDEIADVLIRLGDLSGCFKINVFSLPEDKLEYYKGSFYKKSLVESIFEITQIPTHVILEMTKAKEFAELFDKHLVQARIVREMMAAIIAFSQVKANIDWKIYVSLKLRYNDMREYMHDKKY